jgi:hypothetical protein
MLLVSAIIPVLAPAAKVVREGCGEAGMPAHAFDPDFLEHERIGRATAGVFCLNDDAKNL